MSKEPKRNGASERQAAFLRAQLEATDAETRKKWINDATDSDVLGLSPEAAALVGNVLKDNYLRNIEAQFESGPEEEESEIESDEEQGVDEFSDDNEENGGEEKPEENENPFTNEESEDTEEGGDDIVDFVGDDEGDDLGFPSDEEEIGEDPFGVSTPDGLGEPAVEGETLQPGEELEINLPGGLKLEIELGDTSEVGPVADDAGLGGLADEFAPEPAGLEPELGPEMGPELEPEMGPEIGGGLELGSDIGSDPEIPEEVSIQMAAEKLTEEKKAERSAARRKLLVTAAEQSKPEDIDPSTEKKLGDDTSSGGTAFTMEDGTLGVANPGEKGDTLTLDNSDGNTLAGDPGFAPNEIYTKSPNLLQNEGAKSVQSYEGGKDDAFNRSIEGEETEDKLPTQGDTDLWWGAKNLLEFDVPTQMPETTGDRKTTVASKECSGCTNTAELTVVACGDCDSELAVCPKCISEDYCPVCATAAKMGIENVREATGPNWKMFCTDPKDEKEVVKDDRGDDPNGDGGFRTKDKDGGVPKDKNARELKVDAGDYEEKVQLHKKCSALERTVQEQNWKLAKMLAAAKTAGTMIAVGQLSPEHIENQIGAFMEDDMNVAALESLRHMIAQVASDRRNDRLADIEARMTKEAQRSPVTPSHVGFNINPTQVPEGPKQLTDELDGIFTAYRPEATE